MEKRDNNFTTAEIKRFAKWMDEYTPIEFDNWNNVADVEEELIKIADENGWKYEKKPYEYNGKTYYDIEEFNNLSTSSREHDLSRGLSILAWKILYEREIHKAMLKSVKFELKVLRNQIKDIQKRNGNSIKSIDWDINLEIGEGDEEDYYDDQNY